MSKILEANQKIEKAVVGSYQKIEDKVVGSYKKVEDKFVNTFLKREGETTEEAKVRIAKEQKELKEKNKRIVEGNR